MKRANLNSWKMTVLAAGILGTTMAAPLCGYAEEIQDTYEIEPDSEEILEGDPELTDQSGLTANSFRYMEGQWMPNEVMPLSLDDFIPWSFTDGSWINSLGEPIPSALQKGIDVSYVQEEIDWETVKETDVSYAILRCGYGNDQEDQDDAYWKRNADECTRLDIPFSTYIYSYAMNKAEAKSEAAHVLRLIEGYDFSFPIYLDLEDERYTGTLTNKEIADIAEVFCDTLEEAGCEVGIYANKYWFENKLTDPRFDNWERWVAHYNPSCTYNDTYTMWQCTSAGRVDGITGNVDVNFTIDPSKLDLKPTEPEEEKFVPKDPLEAFVGRLYELILDRVPDEDGLMDWKTRLLNKKETGAEVTWGFVMSNEFISRELSDEEYVVVLYKTCLNRTSDRGGRNYWLNRLRAGLSREYVLRGFAESKEFGEICESFGILRGSIQVTNILDQNPDVALFIYRNYEAFLGRKPDRAGQEDWVTQLVNKEKTPREVAYGFVFSKELLAKKLTNEEYVTVLYRGLFDREPDQAGFNDWMGRLAKGQSRMDIFEGFAGSDEFQRLVKSFGL